ncbi:MAG: NUDIX hydrolase [Myxococcales bacterium]|nr:NUDIX hydrolase [Myxococcales bacterium]
MADPSSLHPNPPPGITLYRDHRLELRRCTLTTRRGDVLERGLVVHPGSVVLLPLLDDGRIVLIRNHRWQLGHPLLELPAGTCEPGEAAARTAARELEEETGFSAARLDPLPPFYAAPGLSTEVMHPFVARGLKIVGQRLEADEDIEVVPMTRDAVQADLSAGRIADAKSLAVLGFYLLGLLPP